MRRAFSLIEVLIGVFVLALALLGLAAIFAKTTHQMAETTDQVFGRSARRSGDALYRTLDRGATPLGLGWSHEPLPSVVAGIGVCAFTFVRQGSDDPIIVVTASFKGPYEYHTSWFDDYTPQNRDTIISWYGHIHPVENGEVRGIQEFEKAYPVLVIPYTKSSLLDVHRLEYIQELDK